MASSCGEAGAADTTRLGGGTGAKSSVWMVTVVPSGGKYPREAGRLELYRPGRPPRGQV